MIPTRLTHKQLCALYLTLFSITFVTLPTHRSFVHEQQFNPHHPTEAPTLPPSNHLSTHPAIPPVSVPTPHPRPNPSSPNIRLYWRGIYKGRHNGRLKRGGEEKRGKGWGKLYPTLNYALECKCSHGSVGSLPRHEFYLLVAFLKSY